jgi:hypothetical protein
MLKIEFCTKNRLVFLGYVIFGKIGGERFLRLVQFLSNILYCELLDGYGDEVST